MQDNQEPTPRVGRDRQATRAQAVEPIRARQWKTWAHAILDTLIAVSFGLLCAAIAGALLSSHGDEDGVGPTASVALMGTHADARIDTIATDR
jgi:hypothetical protein